MFHLRLLRICDLYVHPKMFFFVFVLVFLDELMSQKFVYSSTRLQIGHQTSVYAVSTSLLGLLVPFWFHVVALVKRATFLSGFG